MRTLLFTLLLSLPLALSECHTCRQCRGTGIVYCPWFFRLGEYRCCAWCDGSGTEHTAYGSVNASARTPHR